MDACVDQVGRIRISWTTVAWASFGKKRWEIPVTRSKSNPWEVRLWVAEQFCDASVTSGVGTSDVSTMPTYLPTASPVVALPTFSADIFASVEGESVEKSITTVSPVGAAVDVTPTEASSASNNADKGTEKDSLECHAFSVGDKCEGDATFVSDKGIPCVSFFYAENVRCRSPTGMQDKDPMP